MIAQVHEGQWKYPQGGWGHTVAKCFNFPPSKESVCQHMRQFNESARCGCYTLVLPTSARSGSSDRQLQRFICGGINVIHKLP